MQFGFYEDDDGDFVVLCDVCAEIRRMDGRECSYQCEADDGDTCQDCDDYYELVAGEGDE